MAHVSHRLLDRCRARPATFVETTNHGGRKMPGNMQENGLQRLYMEQLKDIYSAESQLLKALPKMAKAARSQDLRQGFEKHLEQTKGHVERLEQIFSALEENPKGKKCMGMQGLIEEGEE